MKFVDIDGKEHEFQTPGEAVSWAYRELKAIEKELSELYKSIKKLNEYKTRILTEFGLKSKRPRRQKTKISEQQETANVEVSSDKVETQGINSDQNIEKTQI